MSKIVITPQGFYFVKQHLYRHFIQNNEYVFTNGIIENSTKLSILLENADAVVIGSEKITASLMDSSKNLKLIVRFGTSLENIDVIHAKKKGIKVFSIKSQFTVDGVSRLCLTFLLSYSLNIHKHLYDSKSGKWIRYLNRPPSQIIVGLVGAGDIANGFYLLARELGFKFHYFSRNQRESFDDNGVLFHSDLTSLIKASDVVSLHIPLNFETRNFISDQELLLLKNKMLINTSRAEIVNQEKLGEMIESDSMFYFTDVLSSEPPVEKDFKFITNPNVFSTAHIGGYSEDALFDVAMKALTILEREL